jgi:predicted nucleic acid-binding protein
LKKIYWDTSALIVACEDTHVRHCLEKATSCTRIHTLTELFSTLTGGRLAYQCHPEQAWELIENLTEPMTLVEMSGLHVKKQISVAGGFGVRGGRIHDYIHARAAIQCGAEELMTLNKNDFEGLCEGVKIVSP